MVSKEVLGTIKPPSVRLDNLSDMASGSPGTSTPSPHSTKWLTLATISCLVATTYLAWSFCSLVYNVYFHPLRKYPGPIGARASQWWRIYIELWKKESMTEVLRRLHEQYGDVVRTAPDELHFANPKAYFDIYAPAVRWDK